MSETVAGKEKKKKNSLNKDLLPYLLPQSLFQKSSEFSQGQSWWWWPEGVESNRTFVEDKEALAYILYSVPDVPLTVLTLVNGKVIN